MRSATRTTTHHALLLLAVLGSLLASSCETRRRSDARAEKQPLSESENLATNSDFSAGIEGWSAPFFDGQSWRSDVVGLGHVNGGRESASVAPDALKVTISNVPEGVPAYYGGAQVSARRTLSPGAWYRVGFNAKHVAGSRLLAVTRIWGGYNSTPVQLNDHWSRHETLIYLGHETGALWFFPLREDAPSYAADGTFLLDEVSITQLSCSPHPGLLTLAANGAFECDADGWHEQGQNVTISREVSDVGSGSGSLRVSVGPSTSPSLTGAQMGMTVQHSKHTVFAVKFNARRISGDRYLRVTSASGSIVGSGVAVLPETGWGPVEAYVQLPGPSAGLLFVPLAHPDAMAGGTGTFLLDDVRVQQTACAPNLALSTLVANGEFRCGASGWTTTLGVVHPEASVRTSLDNGPRAVGTGPALRVDITVPTSVEGLYSHTTGAVVALKQKLPANSDLNLMFFAKRANRAGARDLAIVRPHGGGGAVEGTIPLSDEWTRHAVRVRTAYETTALLLGLVDAPGSNRSASGAFLVDDVRLVPQPLVSSAATGICEQECSASVDCSEECNFEGGGVTTCGAFGRCKDSCEFVCTAPGEETCTRKCNHRGSDAACNDTYTCPLSCERLCRTKDDCSSECFVGSEKTTCKETYRGGLCVTEQKPDCVTTCDVETACDTACDQTTCGRGGYLCKRDGSSDPGDPDSPDADPAVATCVQWIQKNMPSLDPRICDPL